MHLPVRVRRVLIVFFVADRDATSLPPRLHFNTPKLINIGFDGCRHCSFAENKINAFEVELEFLSQVRSTCLTI